jgi:hypothetical protein
LARNWAANPAVSFFFGHEPEKNTKIFFFGLESKLGVPTAAQKMKKKKSLRTTASRAIAIFFRRERGVIRTVATSVAMAAPSLAVPSDFRHQLNAQTFIGVANVGNADAPHFDLDLDTGQLFNTLNTDEAEAAWMLPFVSPHIQRLKLDGWTNYVSFFPFRFAADGTTWTGPCVDAVALVTGLNKLKAPRAVALLVASVASCSCVCLDDPDLASLKHILTPGEPGRHVHGMQSTFFKDFKVGWSSDPQLVIVKDRDHLLRTTDEGCRNVGCIHRHSRHAHTARIRLDGSVGANGNPTDAVELRQHLTVRETMDLYTLVTNAVTLGVMIGVGRRGLLVLGMIRSLVLQYMLSVAMRHDSEHPPSPSFDQSYALYTDHLNAVAALGNELSDRNMRLPQSGMYTNVDSFALESRFKDLTHALTYQGTVIISSDGSDDDDDDEGDDNDDDDNVRATLPRSKPTRIAFGDTFVNSRILRAAIRASNTEKHNGEGHDPSSLGKSSLTCNGCVTDVNFQVPPFFTKVTNASFDHVNPRGFCVPTWLLIARWPWFRSLLKSGMDESKTRIVNLDFSYDQIHFLDTVFRMRTPFRLKEEIDEAFFHRCWDDFGVINFAQTSLVTFVRKHQETDESSTISAPASTVPFGQFQAPHPQFIPVAHGNNAPPGVNPANAFQFAPNGGAPMVMPVNANLNFDPNAVIRQFNARFPLNRGWKDIGIDVARMLVTRLFKLAVIGGVSYAVLMWHFTFMSRGYNR